jgi:hypothetical protein
MLDKAKQIKLEPLQSVDYSNLTITRMEFQYNPMGRDNKIKLHSPSLCSRGFIFTPIFKNPSLHDCYEANSKVCFNIDVILYDDKSQCSWLDRYL